MGYRGDARPAQPPRDGRNPQRQRVTHALFHKGPATPDMNPLNRKLVAHPKDWLWSSFSFYARRDSGLVRIDPIG